MSQRTIVEFNHDYGDRIKDDPEAFSRAILRLIGSGSEARDVAFDLQWFGVTVTPTHHHSEDVKISIGTYFERSF